MEINDELNKLRESVEQYENLIRSSPFAIGILRTEKLIITTANQAIVEIWGKGWEIMGKSYFEALPELADQGYREVFGAVYNTGVPFNAVETPVNILQNGKMQLKYYNFLLYAQRNMQGEVDGIGIIATEVTSQALFNKQIQESEKRFRLLADSMPQMVWTTDPVGRFNYFNLSLTDYSGLTPEALDQTGWQQIVHPGDSRQTSAAWQNSVQTGEDFLVEHRLRSHIGEPRWHLSRAIPQKDETGAIRMWVGTSTDIQEQKLFTSELERQVNERTKELEQNNIELAKMNRELQSFAYISSHDLQEPLRKIQTFATRLAETERENLSEPGKQYFARMTDAALRMQTLIDDLLAYSRTSSADRKVETSDLNKIIEDVKADFQEDLQQINATINASELCEVRIIPLQFRQLLQNLFSNAIKFSSRERRLEIKITADLVDGETLNSDKLPAGAKYCHIRFSDNGIGFDQRFGEKIFEVFQRLHGRQEYSGTGIGLAIVKRITENHGGMITATGEPGKGSTFDIYIPAN
jgi:PAS domain S-box-containing protein